MTTSARTPAATATYRVKLRKESPRDRTLPPPKPTARVPRVARLLALAHKIDGMIRSGKLKNWAEAARLIGVTRARMTQIANLMLLAPEIQEAILDVRTIITGSDSVAERDLRFVAARVDWRGQQVVDGMGKPPPATTEPLRLLHP